MIDSAKIIRKETITTASVEDAWKAWTTVEGVTSFFVPKANIEPVVGSRYELFSSLKAPKGFQGTEGCKILALERKSISRSSSSRLPSFQTYEDWVRESMSRLGKLPKEGL